MMNDSILSSIKLKLGQSEFDDAYDEDIISYINTALFTLAQAGIGKRGFHIEDQTTSWSDFLDNVDLYMAVKDYIKLYVELLFDPPSVSSVLDAKQSRMEEILWRLNLTNDYED